MTRTRAAQALLVLALSALLLPAFAGPASAGGAITKDSLPTSAQLAEVYPDLAAGSRDVAQANGLAVPGAPGPQEKTDRGTSGVSATYHPASVDSFDFDADHPL